MAICKSYLLWYFIDKSYIVIPNKKIMGNGYLVIHGGLFDFLMDKTTFLRLNNYFPVTMNPFKKGSTWKGNNFLL